MIDTNGEVIKISEETHDVKTFHIRLDREIDFKAGQYCLLSFPEDEDDKESHPFTFANPPTQRNPAEFTIKKVGKFTTRLHEMEEGDKLNVRGPFGKSLIFDETVEDNIVFIAGGSGITPFISAIRLIVDQDLENNVVLLNSNRRERDIIYKDELKEIDERKNNIHIINTLTENAPDNWNGEKRLIDEEMISKYVDNWNKKLWYICGPPPMVDSEKKILIEKQVPKDRIKYENWQLPSKHDFE